MRTRIKRLLRRHRDDLAAARRRAGGGGGDVIPDLNHFTQLVLDQAKSLYRYWPEVGGRLFDRVG